MARSGQLTTRRVASIEHFGAKKTNVCNTVLYIHIYIYIYSNSFCSIDSSGINVLVRVE